MTAFPFNWVDDNASHLDTLLAVIMNYNSKVDDAVCQLDLQTEIEYLIYRITQHRYDRRSFSAVQATLIYIH